MSFGSYLDFAISTLPLIFNLLSTKRCMWQNFWAATCNHQEQISQYLWPWMVHRKLLPQTAAKTEHWYGAVQRWRKVQLQHQRQKGYGIWKVGIMNSSLSSCVSLTLISGHHTVHHQVSTHLEIVCESFHLHKLATTIKQLLARRSSNSLYLLVLVQHQYSKKGGWWKTQKMHHSFPIIIISCSSAGVLSSFYSAFFSTVKLYPVGWLGLCGCSKDLSHSCLLVRSDGI
jgi:hypothetical protein